MSKKYNPQPSDSPAAVLPCEPTTCEPATAKRFKVALKDCPDAVVEAADKTEAFEKFKALRSIKRTVHKPDIAEVA